MILDDGEGSWFGIRHGTEDDGGGGESVRDGGEGVADDDWGPSTGLQMDGVVGAVGLLDGVVPWVELCSI